MIKASDHARAAEAYAFVYRLLQRSYRRGLPVEDTLTWLDTQEYRHRRLAEREAAKWVDVDLGPDA